MIATVDYRYDSFDMRIAKRRQSTIRRKRELARYKKIAMRFVVSLVVIFAIIAGCCSVRSYATQTNNTKFVKNYKSIRVESGDTLEKITDIYMSIEFKTRDNYINEVKSINNLKSDTIHAGEYIIIPFYSAEK